VTRHDAAWSTALRVFGVFYAICSKSNLEQDFWKIEPSFWINNPYWQFSGVWAGPIYGKLIQSKFMSTYSVLFKFRAWARSISGKLIQQSVLEFWGMTRTDFWKTHPTMDKFSKNRSSSCPEFEQNWIGTHTKLMDEFSRKMSGSCPGNWNSEKTLGEFSRKFQ